MSGYLFGWLVINWELLFSVLLALGVGGAVWLAGFSVWAVARLVRRGGSRPAARPAAVERPVNRPVFAPGMAKVGCE